MVPGRGHERRQILLADGQQHVKRRFAERPYGGRHVGDPGPSIARDRLPFRPVDAKQRDAGQHGGLAGVDGHARGERVRGIDQGADPLGAQIGCQAGATAEPADAPRDRRQHRRTGAPGVRQRRIEPGIAGQRAGQRGGFGGAAQDQNAQHVGRYSGDSR